MFIPIPTAGAKGRTLTFASARTAILMMIVTTVALFGAALLFIAPKSSPTDNPLPRYAAIGIMLCTPLAHAVIRNSMIRRLRVPPGEPDEATRVRAQQLYLQLRILMAVMCESFTIIAIILLVNDRSPSLYAIAGAGFLGMIMQFPTRNGLDRFVRHATTDGVRRNTAASFRRQA